MFSALITLALSGALYFALHVTGSGAFPRPLSSTEERACLERIREGDRAAKNCLIEHNLRLVAHIIKKYYSNFKDQDDLISIGTIGLIKAVSTFDYDKGARFATYASRCIENEVLMFFRSKKKSAQDIYISDLFTPKCGTIKSLKLRCRRRLTASGNYRHSVSNTRRNSRMEREADIKIIMGARRVRVMVYEEMDKSFIGGIAPEVAKEDRQRDRDKPSVSAEDNYRRRMKARRDVLYALIYNNFKANHTSMITLTFGTAEGAQDFQNLHDCHRAFKMFIQRVNYKYDGFKYAATFSQQENGNWHYHLISNLVDVSHAELQQLWRNGLTWLFPIATEGTLRGKALYCVNNMNEAAPDALKWEKGYLCSKGMQRNIVLRTWNESEAEECLAAFNEIQESPCTELYTASHPIGVKAEICNQDGTKEMLYEKFTPFTSKLGELGGEEWSSTYHHIKSDADFSHLFHLLDSAKRKTTLNKAT